MRFTTNILLSLVALAPALIAAAPAPQDDAYSTVVESVVVESTVTAPASGPTLSSAAQPGASGAGACTRRRGGRNRWGQGRPSAAGSGAGPGAGSESASASASEVASSIIVDSASASATEIAEPTSTIEEPVAEDTAAPSEQGPVPINAAASDPTAAPGAPADGAASGSEQQEPNGGGSGSQSPPASSAAAPPPEPSASAASGDAESGSSSGGGGGEASAGFEADILKAHNDYRAQWGAGALSWDAEAASFAKDHFTANGCAMEHSGNKAYGENLQGGGLLTAQGALQAWGPGEEGAWRPGGKFSKATGHFTQVVWKATTSLGCAHVVCGDKEIIACEYAPPGNMGGEFDTNVGTKV